MTELSCTAMMMAVGVPFGEEEDIFATGFVVHKEAWRQTTASDEEQIQIA